MSQILKRPFPHTGKHTQTQHVYYQTVRPCVPIMLYGYVFVWVGHKCANRGAFDKDAFAF